MNSSSIAALFGCALAGACVAPDAQAARVVQDFNLDWRFERGDPQRAWEGGYDDSAWRVLDLPHDWSVEGPFSGEWASATGYLPGGIGWYRKSFEAPTSYAGGKVFIYFDGVYSNSEVWVNGVSLGKRPNGYMAFQYDLTPHLNFEGSNTITVRVDHGKYADSRWYTGSGIYRNVSLITTAPIHVAQWGVCASTPQITSERALVKVETAVLNESGEDAALVLEQRLLFGGETVAKTESQVECAPSSEAKVTQRMEILNPKRWDIGTPNLYTLETLVRRGDEVLDNVKTRIGLRELRFDSDKGFFLNGKNLKLKGVCIHHDAGCLGAAFYPKVWARRLDLLKEMGCNAIRMSHNPNATELYDLCDEKGFLVIDEVFDEWERPKKKWLKGWNKGTPGRDGYAEHLAQWGKRDLADVVRKNRNHPSIIMWSIGNEVDYPNDPYTHPILDTEDNPQTWAKFSEELPHAKRLGEIARELAAVVKKHDPTRPVTAGLASALMSNENGYAEALDVAGYNYQEFRYEKDHAQYPKRPLYGSENGMSLKGWKAVTDNDYIMGQFLWTGIEYLGEAGKYPRRSSRAGAIDLANHAKAEFYFRQSLWSAEPMVYIGTSEPPEDGEGKNLWCHKRAMPHWNWAEGDTVRVSGFTNGESIELFLNGQSLGSKPRDDAPEGGAFWDIPYEAGVLKAVARKNGEEHAVFELKTADAPAKLVARCDAAVLRADRQDVAIIDLSIVDDAGRLVYSAQNEITCEITGPARLLGMEDANYINTEDYKDNRQHAHRGRLVAYVQSLGQTGAAKVRFTAPGLDAVEVALEIGAK